MINIKTLEVTGNKEKLTGEFWRLEGKIYHEIKPRNRSHIVNWQYLLISDF